MATFDLMSSMSPEKKMPAPNPIVMSLKISTDAVESRIVNNLEDQKEAGDQRKHHAGDYLSRYLDHVAATFPHSVLLTTVKYTT